MRSNSIFVPYAEVSFYFVGDWNVQRLIADLVLSCGLQFAHLLFNSLQHLEFRSMRFSILFYVDLTAVGMSASV